MHEDELREGLNVYHKTEEDNFMHNDCVIKAVRKKKNPKNDRVTLRYRDSRLGKSRSNPIREYKVPLSSLYRLRFPETEKEKKAQMEEEEQVEAAEAAAHEKELIVRRKLEAAAAVKRRRHQAAKGAADNLTGEDDKDEPACSL